MENFLETSEVKNFAKKWQNPEILKPHFEVDKMDLLHFPYFCALSLCLMHRMIMNQRALDTSGPGEHFKYQ